MDADYFMSEDISNILKEILEEIRIQNTLLALEYIKQHGFRYGPNQNLNPLFNKVLPEWIFEKNIRS